MESKPKGYPTINIDDKAWEDFCKNSSTGNSLKVLLERLKKAKWATEKK